MLAVALRLEHLAVVVGVVVLALYLPISPGEFALLSLAAVAGQEFYAVLTQRYFRGRLAPLVAWLRGDDEVAATDAWRAAASMPVELLRVWWRGGYPIIAGLGFCVFAVWLLSQPAWAIPVLFVIIQVLLAYANGLAALFVERGIQPVLDEVGAGLSEEAVAEAISLPLNRRLMLALPAMNIGLGVAVAGIVQSGNPGISGMAIAVAISAAVALTVGFLFTFLLTTSIVSPIRRLQNATERVGRGDLSTRVPVSASDETGALTQAFNGMVSGLEERERLRDAFGTFVDPQLAERVAQDGTDLRGEDVEVSILFMDVRGFTALSETSTARGVVAQLNALYEIVVPLIIRHGGHANKFIGDGLLAVFGAPERHADHADRAVAAALEIAEEIDAGAAGDLRVGLGVNSGTVVVGTIGGGGRLDFTVIGDAVNTAARVESATRETGDDVLITGETRRRMRAQRGEWEGREPIPLKGKSEPVELYAPARPLNLRAANAKPSPETSPELPRTHNS
ncbi:MAG: adenylate/guanylate cyclase domain-containing protein [Solirubrobacterales bacterium]